MMIENPIPKEEKKLKRENTHLGISPSASTPISSAEKSPPRTRHKESSGSMRGSKKGSRERGEKRKDEKAALPKHQQPITDYYSISSKIIGQYVPLTRLFCAYFLEALFRKYSLV
jgi:hypothetical protein